MSTFHFLTPDQHLVAMEKVPKAQAVIRVQQGEFSPAVGDFPRQAQEAIYSAPSGLCLYLYEFRDYGHLFATQADFMRSLTGNTFSNSILVYDKLGGLRCAFELDFDAALPLMNQYTSIDESYPESDSYVVYRYADESVCYVAFLAHPVQRQGFWFANVGDFEYFYYHVFTA